MAEVTLEGSATPELHVNQTTGSVLVEYGDGERVRFDSLAAYDAANEHLDRQRAAIGFQQTFDTDAYQAKVRRLSDERRSLLAPVGPPIHLTEGNAPEPCENCGFSTTFRRDGRPMHVSCSLRAVEQ